MGPAVVTAVLLLVGIINSVTALNDEEFHTMCSHHHIHMYGDYWTSFNQGPKMRYFQETKTFKEAQAVCHSMHSEMVSIHNQHQMNVAMCMSLYFSAPGMHSFWIGAERSGAVRRPNRPYGQAAPGTQTGFKNEDGTPFKFTNWLPNQPDNWRGSEACVQANVGGWGKWNDINCGVRLAFLCVKK